MRRLVQFSVVLCALAMSCATAQNPSSQKAGPLRNVKSIQVDATAVSKPDAVKDASAPNLIQDSLKNALHSASIEVADTAPVHAHIVLDEFTSGSTAKRFMVGLGAGRSTIDCRLVLQDAEGKEIASTRIRVRGNLMFSPYQGNNTQRRQAVNSFDQRLLEEIEKMK